MKDINYHINLIKDAKKEIIMLLNSNVIDPGKLEDRDYCATVIKNNAYKTSVLDVLMKRIDTENNILMNILLKHMEEKNIDSFHTDELTIKIHKNPSRLVINDESKIDKDYYYEKTELKLDKDLIKKNIKDGLDVKGCEVVQDNRVVIKYKSVNAKECV